MTKKITWEDVKFGDYVVCSNSIGTQYEGIYIDSDIGMGKIMKRLGDYENIYSSWKLISYSQAKYVKMPQFSKYDIVFEKTNENKIPLIIIEDRGDDMLYKCLCLDPIKCDDDDDEKFLTEYFMDDDIEDFTINKEGQ